MLSLLVRHGEVCHIPVCYRTDEHTDIFPGPGYRSDEVFNLNTMEPYSLDHLYREYSEFSKHIVLYLPRTSDLRQLAKLVDDGKQVIVEHYCIEGASKALCAYYGDFKLSLSD